MIRADADRFRPPQMSAAISTPAPLPAEDAIASHLQRAQDEMDALRSELNVLRRRDETLNFYMQRLDDELRLAARIQQDFLPKTLPQLGQIHFHTLFRPAGYVSGDLYDVTRLDERRVGFYMADAVGHGMPAALLTMFLKHALVTKEISPGGYRLLPPSEALRQLNESFISQNLTHATFATALYGMIDVVTRQVTLARAGHPLPLILRTDGTLIPIRSEGGLLGIFPDEKYEDATATLEPGDRLILYTDGVELGFGDSTANADAAWHEELKACSPLSGESLLVELARRLDERNGSLTPKDDLTIIVVEAKAAA